MSILPRLSINFRKTYSRDPTLPASRDIAPFYNQSCPYFLIPLVRKYEYTCRMDGGVLMAPNTSYIKQAIDARACATCNCSSGAPSDSRSRYPNAVCRRQHSTARPPVRPRVDAIRRALLWMKETFTCNASIRLFG